MEVAQHARTAGDLERAESELTSLRRTAEKLESEKLALREVLVRIRLAASVSDGKCVWQHAKTFTAIVKDIDGFALGSERKEGV